MKKKYLYILFVAAFLSLNGCSNILEENVYSELTPGNFLNTDNGKLSVLISAYGNARNWGGGSRVLPSTYTAGEAWNRGGSIEANITPLTNFTWGSNHLWFEDAWNNTYAAIRDANVVIDNTSGVNVTASGMDKQLNAEARFIRAWSYNFLYDWFGPVPLFTTSTPEDAKLGRATNEEMMAFLEKEFTESADILPLTQAQYGRATKGAALGLLCKYYLNTKQWQKCADVAKKIMGLNKYSLVPNYKEVFSLANEGNSELLWVITHAPQAGQTFDALTFPTDYPLPLPNQQVFAARSYFFDSYVNSFATNDTRKDLIITEYVSTAGKKIKLLGNNQSLTGKYEFDPEAAGATQGNDFPVVRYADILLSRAEALNELQGTNQESIDLINMVRARAGIPPLTAGNFSKVSLRDHLLQERNWEFYSEFKRREDLIRQDKFIASAVARGAKAQSFQVLFPIPVAELNANPNLRQNEGY